MIFHALSLAVAFFLFHSLALSWWALCFAFVYMASEKYKPETKIVYVLGALLSQVYVRVNVSPYVCVCE